MNFYKDKNVLVTGGNGFIGSFVVERLIKDGANVSIASRTQKKFLRHVENDIKFVITSKNHLKSSFLLILHHLL